MLWSTTRDVDREGQLLLIIEGLAHMASENASCHALKDFAAICADVDDRTIAAQRTAHCTDANDLAKVGDTVYERGAGDAGSLRWSTLGLYTFDGVC